MDRRTLLRTGAAMAGLHAAVNAFGQTTANTIVWSGFPPGGLGDQISRPLMDHLRGRYPQNLIYDSKPGAGGRISAEFVKRAAPDGSHLLQCPSSVITMHPHVFKKLPYDTLTDFTPIGGIASFTAVFTAGPGLPADITSVAHYLQWAKANPAAANFGIPSTGSSMHMAGMMLARQTGLDLRPVAYRGGGPLLTDLLGGQVPVSFSVVSEVLPHIRSGKLRALAVTAPTRWKALPDVPTMSELGHRDMAFLDWLGWFGPARLDPARVNALNAAMVDGIRSSTMQDIFTKNGLEHMTLSADPFAALVRREHGYWGDVVAKTGFKPED